MGGQVSPGKPFDISKQEVWRAYQKVAANKGAAGVDGVGLTEFESDLKGNLYKIWNRMSSGSYFNTRDFRCFVLPGVLWSWCSVRALESVSIWCVVMVLARVSRRGWRAVPRAAVVPPS